MIAFFEVISTSAPHIYRSALPLSPQASIVYELHRQYAHPLVRAVQGLPISWGPIVATLDIHISYSAIWSPCSRFIIIGDHKATILDAVTLKQLSTLDTTFPSCLCLTPDGHFLLEFEKAKLAKWDLQTGCPIGTIVPGLEAATFNCTTSTCSTDGKLLAAKYDNSHSFISTYNFLSMTHAGPYCPPREIMNPIWIHGECLRFAAREPGYITIWEIEFTLVGPPVEVGSLQIPTEIDGEEINNKVDFLFLPAVSRIAFGLQDAVFIWDAQAAKFLLKSEHMSTPDFTYPHYKTYIQAKSFSSSGYVFACMAIDNCVRVYKEFPTGYILHQQFTLYGIPAVGKTCRLCVSPDGESIIAHGSSKVHLWHTRDHIPPISNASPQGNLGHDLLLEFSPNRVLVAFAQEKGDIVTVFNLQSGGLPFTINVGTKVEKLAVMESAIITANHEEVVIWNILRGNCSLDIGGKIANDIHIRLPGLPSKVIGSLSVSHDLSHILMLMVTRFTGGSPDLWVIDSSTKKHIGGINIDESLGFVQFTPDGCEIQTRERKDPNKMMRWKIVKDSKSGSVELENLGEIPFTLPWQSSLGYEITHDGWVLSPTMERLLWLPHQWRPAGGYGSSAEEGWRWSGQFLGLAHCELSEVVILEFLK